MSTYEVFGKYILLEKIATGGMAEVFLARGTGASGIGKFFAIKRILPQYADSPEFIEMFKDEAKIAINLNHSNIVSIHEFGVEKGQFFLVMDHVEGRNLRQILNKMKKSSLQFSIDQIVYIIKEVAAGLDHAHRCIDGSTGKPLNITHRDMSPQNLMVSFDGETKIVDFGIAKAESQIETTRAGTLKGKFGYMSPEQAEGQPVDLRTDIFSMGIVLWELLANDRLFVANNEINTLRKIRDCQIPSLRKINPNIPSELERIVQKALARDRNLRYQTSAALHRDLNRFLNRQFPDFSPQDFAVFIKSVFSDEIMALRKRLVEYSKANVESSGASEKQFDDRTSLLDTSTNSLVVSHSDIVVKAKPVAPAPVATPALPAPKEDSQDASFSFGANSMPGIGSTPEPQSQSKIPSVTSTSSEQGGAKTDGKEKIDTGFDELPPTTRPGKTISVLDDRVLQMIEPIKGARAPAPALETENFGSGANSSYSRASYTARTSLRPQQRHSNTNGSARFATLMVFALLCVGVYGYLAKYYTPMMSDVIAHTDPYLHSFHVALGVDPGQKTYASEIQPHNPTAGEAQKVAPASEEDTNVAAVVVISNPSGAEILINDKSTGLVTPSRIEIPHGPFDITIHKHGYVDSKMREVTGESLGHRLTVSLVKMNVAYIDIDVFPPQEATISINGKVIAAQHGPIRELPVSANTPLKIRAESKNGQSYDEVTVSLPVDKRHSIQLNPRKIMRLPSSGPAPVPSRQIDPDENQ